MNQAPLRLRVHAERLAIARLDPRAELPAWAQGDFVTLSRTRDELSVVCAQTSVPRDVRQERDRIGLAIAGVIPMSTVGLMASLCTALAAANVPVFVISTYDTDWILVTADKFADARKALQGLGHTVSGELPRD